MRSGAASGVAYSLALGGPTPLHVVITHILIEAVDVIDRKFCPGYAAQHPELVGAFIQAAAMDYVARRIADGLEALAWSG